jgi:hypothetical protein
MARRFRPTFEKLENREVFSANPMTAAPVIETAPATTEYRSLPYIEQENVVKTYQADPNQQQIIAILIGLRQ